MLVLYCQLSTLLLLVATIRAWSLIKYRAQSEHIAIYHANVHMANALRPYITKTALMGTSKWNDNRSQSPKHPSEPEADKNIWRSGYIFSKQNNKRKHRRCDPWWMRHEERNNPRIRAKYAPWWLNQTTGHGIGRNAERSYDDHTAKYRLSDDNFTPPSFIATTYEQHNQCYPMHYEANE